MSGHDDWYAECWYCKEGISDYDDGYKYGVNPVSAEEYYLHDACLDDFHDLTGMGFCDLCDGTTWLAGYHEDSRWDTRPDTGNHEECEVDYGEHKRQWELKKRGGINV